jgi:hypothetical protein
MQQHIDWHEKNPALGHFISCCRRGGRIAFCNTRQASEKDYISCYTNAVSEIPYYVADVNSGHCNEKLHAIVRGHFKLLILQGIAHVLKQSKP